MVAHFAADGDIWRGASLKYMLDDARCHAPLSPSSFPRTSPSPTIEDFAKGNCFCSRPRLSAMHRRGRLSTPSQPPGGKFRAEDGRTHHLCAAVDMPAHVRTMDDVRQAPRIEHAYYDAATRCFWLSTITDHFANFLVTPKQTTQESHDANSFSFSPAEPFEEAAFTFSKTDVSAISSSIMSACFTMTSRRYSTAGRRRELGLSPPHVAGHVSRYASASRYMLPGRANAIERLTARRARLRDFRQDFAYCSLVMRAARLLRDISHTRVSRATKTV